MATNNADFQLNKLFDVKGRVALITGGGSGIGLMAAQALAVNGARVYIVGRTERKLQTAAEVHGNNIAGGIIPLRGDVSDKDDIKRLVNEFASREEYLSILINNAGIFGASQLAEGATADEVKRNLFEPDSATFEDWQQTYRTNCAGLYFVTTAFLPFLQRASERHDGFHAAVINITSINGIIKQSLNHFSSNAAKAAAIHVTEMLAREMAKAGLKIRVNSIAPGVFPSEITAGSSNGSQKSELPAGMLQDISAGRPGNDQDMGNAILFLATNQYLNGQIVALDGGYLLQNGNVPPLF